MKIITLLSNFLNVIEKCHTESGRNKINLFTGMVLNRMLYRVRLDEYYTLQLHKRSNLYGRHVITRDYRNRIVKRYNSEEGIKVFEDKALFNNTFQAYLGRFSQLANKISKKDMEMLQKQNIKFVLKPIDGVQGRGIRIINSSKNQLEEVIDSLVDKEKYLLEEFVEQNEVLNTISPKGLSVIRITTITNGNYVEIVACYIVVSNINEIVNYHTDGIVCLVDWNEGQITTDGSTESGQIYKEQPYTKVKFRGFDIPNFELAKELVLNAAKLRKDVGFVGWDVAISKRGPIIIEGNAKSPGITTFQLPIFENYDFARTFKNTMKIISR